MLSEAKRILFFEDDFETMCLFKEHLEEMHYIVEMTASETILARLSQERFDLIIVDIMIQPQSLDAAEKVVKNVHYDNVNWKLTGVEFFRRLRRGEYSSPSGDGTSPNVPVIFLSAVGGIPLEEKLIGNCYQMEKPFRIEKLVQLIRQVSQEHSPNA